MEKKKEEKKIMHAFVGVISALFLVGVILAPPLATNYASATTGYATADCCTGPSDGCNPCAGGTSTTTTTTTAGVRMATGAPVKAK